MSASQIDGVDWFIQPDAQAPVDPAEVVHPVHQIAHRLPDMREPREREAPADLVRVHAPGGAIVSFYGRRVGCGVSQGREFLIDAPLGVSGAFDADIRHPFALIRLDDAHVPCSAGNAVLELWETVHESPDAEAGRVARTRLGTAIRTAASHR